MKEFCQFGMKKGDGGQIFLDVRPRRIAMTWPQFECICESLHNYSNCVGEKPNAKQAYAIADELIEEWHRYDGKLDEEVGNDIS